MMAAQANDLNGTTALVVFGRDNAGKPHASRFALPDAELAEKAAGLMGMHVLRATTEEHQELAAKLPRGRVFESGRAFVPFVRASLYGPLAALAGVSPTEQPANASSACTGSASPPAAASAGHAPLGGSASAGPHLPRNWDEIATGSIVLANEGSSEGWWEAAVVGVKEDLLTLRWRDWPEEATMVRRRADVALLPPGALP